MVCRSHPFGRHALPQQAFPRVLARGFFPVATLLVSVTFFGCGHPASEAECQLIVDKNVELQIAAMSAPPPDVEKEKARVRAEMEPMLKACPGHRITDGKLACVRGAKSTKEIDACMQ